MTAPYRLRDAYGDDRAGIYLIGMISAAGLVGMFPSTAEAWSLGAASTAAYVALSLVALLLMMNAADGRLREVSG